MSRAPQKIPPLVQIIEAKTYQLHKFVTNYRLPVVKYRLSLPNIILGLLIVTYTLYFSWYTINRHNTLNSYAADLSLIDQAMWNTVLGPGDFMELTWGEQQQPRLAEHFEPILMPLALLFLIWDNVRIILVAQSFALALGALPIYWVARKQLTDPKSAAKTLKSDWAALVFAATYLLSPYIQAANIADFHADPFAVAPLLFAFWYATQQRWRWMWFWAILVMLTKENLPTLTAMLGLFIIFDHYRTQKSCPTTSDKQLPIMHRQAPLFQGVLLIIISVAWFFSATFLIVSPLAQQYFGSNGPIYLANRFEGGLSTLPQMLQESARWQYLLGFFTSFGFLPLLGPELLLLGLPILLANMFSNFPGQYSGEQHYSAPLVVAFVLAAIYGARRLIALIPVGEKNGQSFKQSALIAACLWSMSWSLAYHTLYGWSPFSIRTESYTISPAAASLPDFIELIPAEAIISASPGLHPHVAHRRVVYIFPTIEDADYLLVDITDISGVHPNDVHAQITVMLLKQGWSILKASHGLLLAQKNVNISSSAASQETLSISNPQSPFLDFTQATTNPTYPTKLTFGHKQLYMLGYDVQDDPDDGTSFRFYWQATSPLPTGLKLWPLIYNDSGQLLSDPDQVPMIAPIWYPPAQWQPAEIIITETLAQHLPPNFHLGVAVGLNNFKDNVHHLPLTQASDNVQIQPGEWGQLATFSRQGPFLRHKAPTKILQPLIPIEAQFETIQLTGYRFEAHNSPTKRITIVLEWLAKQPPPTNFTTFIHLTDSAGTIVSQIDAYPTWLTPHPTSHWPPNQPILASHILTIPPNLPARTYTIEVGFYNSETMKRLILPNGNNALTLEQIDIK